jgi:Co/Zn/Cd efflux system component
MQTLVTIVTLVGCVAAAVGGMLVIGKAPVHANLGGWSEILLPLGVTVGVMAVVAAALLGGAWGLWRAEHKMAAQLLGVMTVVASILVWKLADALNVLLDDSPPERHASELLELVGSTPKREGYFVLRSWRTPGQTLAIDLPLQGAALVPGTPVVVTTHGGAFGRPYAVRLEPAAVAP